MPPLIGSDEESGGEDIPFRDSKAVANDEEEEDEGEEGEDGEEDEDEYVIETITEHMIDEEGEILYHVKWEGYDDPTDMTWEPIENLAPAKETLKAYHKSIGGDPAKTGNKGGPKSASKKRKATSTPSSAKAPKRGKSETPEQSTRTKKGRQSGASTIVKDEWKLPKGSWEEQVSSIDTIEEALDEKGEMQRFVYVMWETGRKTRHQLETVNQKCPQKMLRYYESHLVFRSTDGAETNGGADA